MERDISQRLTLGSLRYTPGGVRPSRLSVLANVCPDDPRIADWVNGFEDRALSYGRWWGTAQLMRMCVTQGCKITLPREVAVIEAANLNGMPMNMGNDWNSFIRPHVPCGNLLGSNFNCHCGCGCTTKFTMQEENTAASFATTTGTNKKIRVYLTNFADAGKKIIIQGYDSNGIWVRTSYGGSVQDGEQVTLPSSPTTFADTATVWGPSPNKRCVGAPVNVIKDVTSYRVLLYSLNTGDDTEIQLAIYGPTETRPMYRVVSIPGFRQGNDCGCSSSTLSAIVSLQHIPVVVDSDFLLFQNLGAYQDGVLAEKAFEEGDMAKGNAYFFGVKTSPNSARGSMRSVSQGGALPSLQAEARKMCGDVTAINVHHTGVSLVSFQ